MSTLRYTAVAAFISSVSSFDLSAPSATVSGHANPLYPAPTEPPSLDLVRRRLERRNDTNACTEWSILGGYGPPECDSGGTCLFSSANGHYMEGCGATSTRYNWITECHDYGAQSGSAPISQTYCPSSQPSCGFYAFIFTSDYTFYNYFCDSTSIVYTVQTVSGAPVSLQIAASATSESVDPLVTETAASSSTSTATIGSHKGKHKPIGAIVGGVVGGLAVFALLAFLIFWFCVRKRTRARAAAQADAVHTAYEQQQADAATTVAYHNVAEMGGGREKPLTAYTPANLYPEKPVDGQPGLSAYAANNQVPSELEDSPAGTMYTPSTASPAVGVAGLAGDKRGKYSPVPQVNELDGESQPSSPPPRQEMAGRRPPPEAMRYDMAGAPMHPEYQGA